MIIGVLGLSGSGKSTFCKTLSDLGAYIIDADVIAREVVAKGTEGLKEITEYFGKEVLLSDGTLNRKKLGEIVFNNSEKLEVLNKITHKRVQEEIEARIFKNPDKLIVIDAPLLHKISTITMCDQVVLITAPEDILIKRIVERDGISPNVAKARIKSQVNDYKVNATIIIENNSDITKLIHKAEKLGKEWLK